MHPRMLAKREADAQTRIMAATAKLAESFGIDAPATVNQRQPDVAAMMRWESVADWLENLASAHAEREEQAAEAAALREQLAQLEAEAKAKAEAEAAAKAEAEAKVQADAASQPGPEDKPKPKKGKAADEQ